MKKNGSHNILTMLAPYQEPLTERVEQESELHPSLSVNIDQDMHDMYKKAEASFWVLEELEAELAKDPKHWENLEKEKSDFLKHILAFFAVSDFYVNETIVEQIKTRVMNLHWWRWEDFKVMMENTHNKTYGRLAEVAVPDKIERRVILDAVQYNPVIQKKIDWMHRWVGKDNELVHLARQKQIAIRELYNSFIADKLTAIKALGISVDRLDEFIPEYIQALGHELNTPKKSLAMVVLINAITEGVFFSGSFCAIFWFKEQGLLPGLTLANEWISRDEGLHTCFAIMVYKYKLQHQLPQKLVHQIVGEAVEIEQDFICEALPADMTGMNSRLMTQYIQFTADQLLHYLGYEKIWNVDNPFRWMEQQSIGVRMSDFFKRPPSAYGHHASGLATEELELGFSEDF
jgi:ribonucleotide reductase beta subunit family protein with ferritin-like domain